MARHRYSRLLSEFVAKDVVGVKITDEWPELRELKSRQGMLQGFRTAIKRAELDNVRAIESHDGFYLIRTDKRLAEADLPNTSRRTVSYG